MTPREKVLLKLAIKGLTDDEPLADWSTQPPTYNTPDDFIGYENAMNILCALRDGRQQTAFVRDYYKKFGGTA